MIRWIDWHPIEVKKLVDTYTEKYLKDWESFVRSEEERKKAETQNGNESKQKPLDRNETAKPASIFRVSSYEYRSASPQKRRYPCFKLNLTSSSFHLSLKDAEEEVADKGLLYRNVSEITKLSPVMRPYAYVITEIPLEMDVNLDLLELNLSERIHNPYGTLWGKGIAATSSFCTVWERNTAIGDA